MFTAFAVAFDGGDDASGRLLRALDHPHRRAALSGLLEASDPLEVDELAARVRERVESETEDVPLSLRHHHLPVLSEAGLIDRSEDGVVVSETYRTPLARALAWIDGTVPESWQELGSLLSDPISWATVVELDERGPEAALDLDCLASAVADRAGPERDPETVAIELHHVHLPKLEDAGVVEFDPESGRIECRDHSSSSIPTPGSLVQTLSEVEVPESRSRRDPPA